MVNDIAIVLHSLNPDHRLNLVVDGVMEQGFKTIIIVNDGSDNEHLAPFAEAQKKPGVTVLTHPVNYGKGHALKTAFEYCKNNLDIAGVVTIDGDGQHHPEDIRACALRMKETGNVVLGCRDFSLPDVPFKSRNGNNITKFVFRTFCGIKISDTQTGLRAIPAKYFDDMLETSGERFEYETNMLLEMKRRKIGFDEVKIRTIYEDNNKSTHFHPFRDSYKIYKVIFKFMFSKKSKG